MPSPSPNITPYTLSPHVADLIIDPARPHAVHGGPMVRYRDEATRRRKVAICGSGGAQQMPWDDPTFECWSINNFWESSRDSEGRIAASRWWEQHQITPDTAGPRRGQVIQNENDMAWIRQCPVPLYTTEPVPENTHAVVWPVEYFAAKYRDYFCCTFAYQIAQAIEEDFKELHVYGLELLMGTKREATVESSCTNYWLGLAEGRGVKVVIPDRVAVIGRSWVTHREIEVEPVRPQFLLVHPYRYGHDYWMETDFVKEFVSRWDTRKVAV